MQEDVGSKVTPSIDALDVLWITAGLGCDRNTIAMTAATNPSIEDILMGNIPGIPKVTLHNPVLSYRSGEDFLKPYHDAAQGHLAPFILVIEGSVPNERIKSEGYWTGFGLDAVTGQPMTLQNGSIDSLQRLGQSSRRNLCHLRRYSRDGG